MPEEKKDCEHVYGFCNSIDDLIYSEKDLDKYLNDSYSSLELFEFCPHCGIKFDTLKLWQDKYEN
jgi:hypothetical protein